MSPFYCSQAIPCAAKPDSRISAGPGKLGQRRYVKIHYGSDARVRKRFFQRLRRPEKKYYFGYYDSKKYHEKMKQYKEGKIKSRPNGRTWCLLNENLHFIARDEKETSLRRYYEFCSSLRSKYRTSKNRKKRGIVTYS